MQYEKSCGFIAYMQVENKNHYLLIRSHNGDVGFPKGHTEPGESEIETAIRELKEETGMTVEVVPGFRQQVEYRLPRKKNVIKQVVYFLGRCTTDKITPQEEEVDEVTLLPYDNALEALTFDEMKRILKASEEFIRSRQNE